MDIDIINKLDEIAKRRGFFWPSFEIYQGCSGFYTYGPAGAMLKKNVENLIAEHFLRQENCLMVEAPLLTSEQPWIASGHTESFNDMSVECQKCGEAYRADHLIEEKTKKNAEGLSLPEMQKLIEKNKIKCPKCGGGLGSVYDYSLMFKTSIGPGKNKITGYLRPETAQTTYMPFRRLFELARKSIPFGVIQVGRSFRNEISPRKALVRLREFSQAEVQFFMDPEKKDKHEKFQEVKNMEVVVLTKDGQEERKVKLAALVKSGLSESIAYFLGVSIKLFLEMGMDEKKLRCRQHKDNERSFYSEDTWDVEFMSDVYGRVELVGIADRTDYDLKRHMEFSKQNMNVRVNGKEFIPHIIEIAYGIDRPVLCIMESCIRQEKERTFFSFPAAVSPYQVAVFPLVKKDGLPEKAKIVFELVRKNFSALYDQSGSIGRMYYRQDEVGTRSEVTCDYQTMKDKTVTIRDRDTQKQVRVKLDDLVEKLNQFFSGTPLEKLGVAVK